MLSLFMLKKILIGLLLILLNFIMVWSSTKGYFENFPFQIMLFYLPIILSLIGSGFILLSIKSKLLRMTLYPVLVYVVFRVDIYIFVLAGGKFFELY